MEISTEGQQHSEARWGALAQQLQVRRKANTISQSIACGLCMFSLHVYHPFMSAVKPQHKEKAVTSTGLQCTYTSIIYTKYALSYIRHHRRHSLQSVASTHTVEHLYIINSLVLKLISIPIYYCHSIRSTLFVQEHCSSYMTVQADLLTGPLCSTISQACSVEAILQEDMNQFITDSYESKSLKKVLAVLIDLASFITLWLMQTWTVH